MMSNNPGRPLAAHVQAAIAKGQGVGVQPKVSEVTPGREMAAHVQQAIQRSLQARMQTPAASGRPVAAHVQAAVEAGRGGGVQLKSAATMVGGRQVAAHVQRAVAGAMQAKVAMPKSAQAGSVVQGSFANGQPRSSAPLPEHLRSTLGRGTGQRLPAVVQRKMESLFGSDFSDVRIHVGPEASSIGALAFTYGSNIHFAPGQYNPTTSHGQRLLAHELTHVLQQQTGRVRNPFGAGLAMIQDPAMESEANRMGVRAAEERRLRDSKGGTLQLSEETTGKTKKKRKRSPTPPPPPSSRPRHSSDHSSSSSSTKYTKAEHGSVRSKTKHIVREGWEEKKGNQLEQMYGGTDQVRRARSYEHDRPRQILRWLANLILAMFPQGVEIQCYYDKADKLVWISSNTDGVNKKLEEGREQLVEKLKGRKGSGRCRRHRQKLFGRKRERKAEQNPIHSAIEKGNFKVPTGGHEIDLHAERRIKEALGPNKTLDPAYLAGVKRPCLACYYALDLNLDDKNDWRPGPLYVSMAGIGLKAEQEELETAADKLVDRALKDNVRTNVTMSRDDCLDLGHNTDSDTDADSDSEPESERDRRRRRRATNA